MVRRLLTVVSVTVFSLFLALPAWAQAPLPETVVGDGAESLKDSMLAVAVQILPYAAVLAAVSVGWRWARRFLRG